MQYGIIIAVVIYELIVILGVSAVLRKKEAEALEKEGGFALAGRSMGVAVLSPTIALTVLGAAHITGVFEMSYGMGAAAIWFSLAHVIMIVIACFGTGIWVRRLGVVTVPEIIKGMYGPGIAIAVTCTMAGAVTGVLTLECQGLGIVVSALTGWKITYGVFLGGALGIMYVIFAGMKEVGVVNLINAVVMYVGLIIATIFIMSKLPGGDFTTIVKTLETDPEGGKWMTSIFGTPNIMITFAVGQILAVTFCQSISQMLMQTMMSAKNEKTIRRSVWIAAPVNGLFGVFAVCIGLAARAIPEYAAHGPKTAAMSMIVEMLPTGVSALLLAALLAAILSTFAMTSLTPATMWVNDIYKQFINPEASEKKLANMTRVLIVIIALFAMIVSTALPTILDAIGWVFSWVIPVWWMVAFGLFWKRNSTVTVLALVVPWILNILWSFTNIREVIGGVIGGLPNAYVTMISCLLIFVIGNAISKGEPAYRKVIPWKEV
ncbi:MAG: sodium:solute symporter family protein [Anaerovoracaceae bacterium]|jgi:SSS family solute:Na+ symporter